MRKNLLMSLFCILNLSISAKDKIDYVEYYVDIIDNLYQEYQHGALRSSCNNDSLFFIYEEDSVINKQIASHIDNPKIKSEEPLESLPFHALYPPRLEYDGGVVFPIAKVTKENDDYIVNNKFLYIYKRKSGEPKLIEKINCNAVGYLDQYVEILNSLAQVRNSLNDTIYYEYEADAEMEKMIDDVTPPYILKGEPSGLFPYYILYPPKFEYGGSIVFPVGEATKKNYAYAIDYINLYIYKKEKEKLKLTATILEKEKVEDNASCYLDQYAEILEFLSQAGNSMNDSIYFKFYTDTITEKKINDITPPYILNDLPPNGESLYVLNPPHIQKDGSVVFNVGLAGRANCNIIIGGTETFVFKKSRRKLRLISVIESGI